MANASFLRLIMEKSTRSRLFSKQNKLINARLIFMLYFYGDGIKNVTEDQRPTLLACSYSSLDISRE